MTYFDLGTLIIYMATNLVVGMPSLTNKLVCFIKDNSKILILHLLLMSLISQISRLSILHTTS